MKVYLYVCCLSVCINLCQAQERLITVQDSFERIIAQETDDSIKVRHITRFISETKSKNENEILSLFDQGKKLCEGIESEEVLYHLYIGISTKLSMIGYQAQGKNKCEELMTVLNNQPELNIKYYSKGQIILARFDIEEGNLKSADDRINSIIDIHRDIEPTIQLLLAYNEKAISLRNQGVLDEALMYSDSAIAVCKVIDNKSEEANVHSGRGRIYRALGRNDKAREDYLTALKIIEDNDEDKSLSAVLNNLGNIEHISGNYDKAIGYYIQSLEIKERNNNARGIAIACHNIGAIKFDMKDWDGAIDDFNKSNDESYNIDFKPLIVHNELKIGNVYYEKGLYDIAISHHTKALELSKEISFSYGEINGLYNLGRDNLAKGDLQNASLLLLEALDMAEQNGNRPLESSILISLSEVYMKSSEGDSRTIDKVFYKGVNIEELLLRAKQMSEEMNSAQNKLDVMSALHNHYYSKRDYRKDAEVLSEYVILKDSLFNSQMAESVADWQTKYKTAEQEKEIIELESANKIESLKSKQFKNLLIGSLAGFTMIFIFGYNYLKQINRRKQSKQRELFRSKLSSDLHDDVGSILTGLAMQSELLSNFVDGNVKDSMDKLAHMSRDAMTRMRDTVWAIDSRKDSFPDLIDRMLDFGKDLLQPRDIQLIMNSNLGNNNKLIEPILRQNLYLIYKEAITNVSKYSSGNKVEVDLSIDRNRVNMVIQDNGNVDATAVKTSGTGTSNIIQRAEDLSGKANISYDHNGYRVELVIPLN